MKTFDVVASNPPFQDRAKRNTTPHKVWIDFTHKAFSVLNDGGKLLWISPQSWSSPSNKVLKYFRKYKVHCVDFDTGNFFPDIGSTFSDYMIEKTGDQSFLSNINKDNKSFNVVLGDQTFYLPNDLSKDAYEIHKKVIFNPIKKLDVKYDYVTCHNIVLKKGDSLSKRFLLPHHINPVFHTNRQVWYSSKRQVFADKKKVMWTRSGYTQPFLDLGIHGGTDMCYYVVVETEKEGRNLLHNLSSDLFKYIFVTAKWSGFGNEKVFKSLPDIPRDKSYSNNELCKFYGLDQSQIDYIKKYHSQVKNKSKAAVSKTQTKTQDRIDNLGEVFTPPKKIKQMLGRLLVSDWQPEKTFLEPCCGNGNFLIEIVKHKIQHGSSQLQALETTFGVDIMEDNILEARKRLLELTNGDYVKVVEKNIVKGNFLETKTF